MNRRGRVLLWVFGPWLAFGARAWAAPVVEVAAPVDGGLVRGAEVMLRGRVEGVVRLLVDGAEVAIEGDRFVAGPCAHQSLIRKRR